MNNRSPVLAIGEALVVSVLWAGCTPRPIDPLTCRSVADCTKPLPCETVEGAACVDELCTYPAKSCNLPPPALCVNGNSTYRTFAPAGTCQPDGSCQYESTDTTCLDCSTSCLGCDPGALQCRGVMPQTCDSTRQWQDGTACPYVCLDGSCTGTCAPGAKRCSGNTPELCDDSGQWAAGPVCQYVCSLGACGGVCLPGATQSCGSSSTCNPSATQTCDGAGTWGACTPAPVRTCSPGNSYGCTTCSTLSTFSSGTHVCSSSCSFSGVACVPTANATWSPFATTAGLLHDCGASVGEQQWNVPSGTGPCYVQRGPFATLPGGRYEVVFSLYGASQGHVTLDVTRNGSCADGGLCPVSVDPYNAQSTNEFHYTITLPDCLSGWEIRIYKEGAAGMTYYYQTRLKYLGP